MHVRDFKIRLDSLEKIKIEYDGPHGGLYTRYVRDIETLVQFFRSKAHEAGIGVRGLRITLEDGNE